MIDGEALRGEVREAARAAFGEVHAEHGAELCAFALYSDSDGGTICVAVNTRDHLARTTVASPEWAEHRVWEPAEWAHENIAVDHFDALHDWLDESRDRIDSEFDHATFDKYRTTVWEACVRALEDLVADGALPADDDHLVTFVVSDHESGRELDWVRRLNAPAMWHRYAATRKD
jgi:hypothetical protein